MGDTTLRLDSWFNPTWHTNDSPNQVCPGARFPQPGAPFLLIPRFVSAGRRARFLGNPWQMFSQPELQSISRMLAEPGVSDVVINGHDHAEVLVGSSWRRVEAGFADPESLDAAARLLIAIGGRQIDLAHPFANVDIDGKLRVHALLASAVNSKTHISIRVHAARQVALEQLMQIKMLSATQLSLLREILRVRQSFLISGAAGSGKTTLLRAMLGELTAERVITIEDVAELQLESASCVSLCSREANVESKGAISLQQLLLESLRMRPDRLVIGEVRSVELITLMQAINTGHSACATIHANSADQVRERIIGIAVAAGLSGADTWQQFSKSIDWLIHIENRSGSRAVELRRLNE